MKLFNIGEISQKAKQAFIRFPIVLTWSILGTFFVLAIIEFDTDFDNYVREILTLFLGVSWLIGTRFFVEQQKDSKSKWWVFVLVILLLIVFFFHLPKENTFDNPIYYTRFLLYLLAGHLFLFVAPFLNSWNKNAFWNYLKSVFIAIGRGLLFSIVLYLGLSLALLAVQYLFNVDIDGDRYLQIYVFCLGIINTWTYLSDFPNSIQTNTNINYNKALEVFVKYILIPLVILYIIILYAYSVKILISWNLPKGWVSYLVIALSLLGFVIQTMINPIQKTIKSATINKFYPWFYFLLLPLLILLFVAIFKRIGDYGFTENRYFVLILASWISIMTLYLLFSKNKFLKILPITLTVLVLLSSVGFWSAFNVSNNSQLSHFEITYNSVKQNNNIATTSEYRSLQSILRYFNYRENLNVLNPIVGIELHNFKNHNNRIKYVGYFNPNNILDSLGIPSPKDKDDINGYSYKSFNLSKASLNVDIGDFNSLNHVEFSEKNNSNRTINNLAFLLIDNKSRAVIKKDESTLFELNIKSLFDKNNSSNYEWSLPAEDLTLNFENETLTIKLIIDMINLKKEDDINEIQLLSAYVLIKEND